MEQDMIRVEGLFARAGKTEILKNLDLAVAKGEFVALVGPNGAGKTTLLKHLNGLKTPSAGRVVVAGMDTRRTRTSTLARTVGFLFQNPDHQIISSRVKDELEFGLNHTGVPQDEHAERVADAAASVGIENLLEADPFTLPRALRQRVALASVLALRPRILVLDEPTSAQDERGTARVMEIARNLNRRGTTVILVSHDMELVARYAERVLLLVDGEILADLPAGEFFLADPLLDRGGLVKPGAYRLAAALGLLPENPSRLPGKPLDAVSIADAVGKALSLKVSA